MVFCFKNVFAFVLFVVMLFSGCTTSTYNKAKNIPEIKNFLVEHPAAKLKIEKVPYDTSAMAGLITSKCKNIPQNNYYFVRAFDENYELHIWVESRKWNPVCISEFSKLKQEKKTKKTVSMGSIFLAVKQKNLGQQVVWNTIEGISIISRDKNEYPAAIENSKAVFNSDKQQLVYIGKIRAQFKRYNKVTLTTGEIKTIFKGNTTTLFRGKKVVFPANLSLMPFSKTLILLDFNVDLKKENGYSIQIEGYENAVTNIVEENNAKILSTKTDLRPNFVSKIFFDKSGTETKNVFLDNETIEKVLDLTKFKQVTGLNVLDYNQVMVTGMTGTKKGFALIDSNNFNLIEKEFEDE